MCRVATSDPLAVGDRHDGQLAGKWQGHQGLINPLALIIKIQISIKILKPHGSQVMSYKVMSYEVVSLPIGRGSSGPFLDSTRFGEREEEKRLIKVDN